MVERMVTVKNKMGIHARPAAMLVQLVGKYKSEIYFEKDGERVNGSSIMGVMLLAAARNSMIKVIAEGDDELEAIDSIESLFNSAFGEDDG